MIADFNSALCECLAFNERLNEEIDRIFRTLKDALGERPIVLYGLTSLVSAEILNFFKERGLQAACICDPQGVSDEFSGVPVIGPQTLKNDFANATVVVCVNYDNDEAECVLAAHGFPRHRIIPWKWMELLMKLKLSLHLSKPFHRHIDKYFWAYDLFEDELSKQTVLVWLRNKLCNIPMDMPSPHEKYFEDGYTSFRDREIFVDGGANEGESAIAFIKQMEAAKCEYSHIYSFEPDSVHYDLTIKNLSNYPNITVIPKGMWHTETELTFFQEGAVGMGSSFVNISSYSDRGTVVQNVPVTSLDTLFAEAPDSVLPTFIKMDIEGAEKEALIGASGVISRVKPKLAICAYHKPEDLYVLPQTIMRIRDDYRFALRQHAPELHEIILYAV